MTRVVCSMFQVNKVFFYRLSFRAVCLLLNFASADCRKWLPSKKIIQRLLISSFSVKFVLFWFSPQPITRQKTDIQKWLWPGLGDKACLAKRHGINANLSMIVVFLHRYSQLKIFNQIGGVGKHNTAGF